MCRIFGSFGENPMKIKQLAETSNLQYNGGPDEQTIILREQWSLGINRLSIQGLMNGSQPFTLDDKIYAVFNGEIYNHVQLKRLLTSMNYRIDNGSDGSIIPALYAEFGDRFAEMLDGMFAIAIIDCRSEPKLLLACDPSGIKSLYYKVEESSILFSSEVSGLWPLCASKPEVLIEKFDMYCSMQSIIGEQTIFKGVKVLKPGVVKEWSITLDEQQLFHSGPFFSFEKNLNFNEAAQYLQGMMSDEISSMLSADVPVCLVTSGGLDSSLVSVLASSKRQGIKAFNIAYKGTWPDDERKYAIEVAQTYGFDIEVIESDPDSFVEYLPKMVSHLGQPNAAPHALSTYLLFKAIRERGYKVAITGEGADEQFGGYARFAEAVFSSSDQWSDSYMDKLSAIPKIIRDELYHEDYQHYLSQTPSGYEKIVEDIKDFKGKSKLNHLLNYDLTERFPYYILRRVDHLSMAHSVEVRVPFCQPKITKFAASLPEEWKITSSQVKRILYQSSKGLVPDSVMNRPKQPFTLPIEAMLLPPNSLFYFFCEIVLEGVLINSGFLNRQAVKRMIDGLVRRENTKSTKVLWSLGIYELWLRSSHVNSNEVGISNLLRVK